MPLFCWIRGSGSAWEGGWLVSECEECEGDEGFGSVEAECDSGEESDLGVGRLDEGVGQPGVEGVIDRHSVLTILRASSTKAGMRERRAQDSHLSRACLPASPLTANTNRSPSLRR